MAVGRKRRGRPEQEAGAMLVRWIDLVTLPDGTKPGKYFAHTPNGGWRSRVEAAIFRGQGVRRGWPDYTLYLPRGWYHGFVLELKAPQGGKPEAEQLAILSRLEKAGYAVAVAWGFDHARREIENYLALPAGEQQ